MAATLEGRPLEILEGANYAVVGIPRRDGTVHSVVVWQHPEDGVITFNSAEGRRWPETLREARTATVTVMADGNPYEWVAVTGSLERDTHEDAEGHIDRLAKKYLDADSYPFRKEGEQRVTLTLRPERVHYNPPA
jgi:PPOX class probable F420-dependent enzyme